VAMVQAGQPKNYTEIPAMHGLIFSIAPRPVQFTHSTTHLGPGALFRGAKLPGSENEVKDTSSS
jgi:hypothetical protein